MKLIDERTLDGSRQFASLPQVVSWDAIRQHVSLLAGARLADAQENWPNRNWIDFRVGQHHFFVKSHNNCLALFVRDPQCPDLILYQIGAHFEQLLEEGDSAEAG